MKFIIIHGSFSNSQDNWFPWLKQQLSHSGNEVVLIDFPTPQGQNFDIWMHELNKKSGEINDQTVFVGHSAGCAFILSVIEKSRKPIKAAFLVSGFVGPLGLEIDKINKNFAEKDFDWIKIKKNCKKFVLFHSNNDPFVPLQKGKDLEEKLGAEMVIIPNGAHFNSNSGFTKFPQLLEKIFDLVK